MRKLTTTGFICLEDDYKFIYKIAKIEYEEWEDNLTEIEDEMDSVQARISELKGN